MQKDIGFATNPDLRNLTTTVSAVLIGPGDKTDDLCG